jgi:DNA-3-methyladenine glycosylase
VRPEFYARDVCTVARELIGCVVRHGECVGVIVETEAYHESEPACHAFIGRTARTETLFAPPGYAYVYRSYGIHALLNAVAEPAGIGAAALIRALEPLEGIELMCERRGTDTLAELCSGPGKLTQALGIGLEHNGADLRAGPVVISPPPADRRGRKMVSSPRIGITKAVDLTWRYSSAGSEFVSRPRPPASAAQHGR